MTHLIRRSALRASARRLLLGRQTFHLQSEVRLFSRDVARRSNQEPPIFKKLKEEFHHEDQQRNWEVADYVSFFEHMQSRRDSAKVVEAINKAVKLNKDKPEMWMEGIRTLMEFGELSRAATLIIQAPLRKVQVPESVVNACLKSACESGNVSAARRLFRDLRDPTVFQYTRFVNVLLRNMMYDEAEQYLNEMVDLPGVAMEQNVIYQVLHEVSNMTGVDGAAFSSHLLKYMLKHEETVPYIEYKSVAVLLNSLLSGHCVEDAIGLLDNFGADRPFASRFFDDIVVEMVERNFTGPAAALSVSMFKLRLFLTDESIRFLLQSLLRDGDIQNLIELEPLVKAMTDSDEFTARCTTSAKVARGDRLDIEEESTTMDSENFRTLLLGCNLTGAHDAALEGITRMRTERRPPSGMYVKLIRMASHEPESCADVGLPACIMMLEDGFDIIQDPYLYNRLMAGGLETAPELVFRLFNALRERGHEDMLNPHLCERLEWAQERVVHVGSGNDTGNDRKS